MNKTISSIIGYVPDWLGTPSLAILVIALMIAWRFSGYYALIFLSGLQSIPNELYEAAQIDGAGRIKSFFKITIPQLYPALYSVMILAVGLMFGVFTEPYMLTGGRPESRHSHVVPGDLLPGLQHPAGRLCLQHRPV